MAVLIVLWLYLLTTKLRCLQKNNIEHTKLHIPLGWTKTPKLIQTWPSRRYFYLWSWHRSWDPQLLNEWKIQNVLVNDRFNWFCNKWFDIVKEKYVVLYCIEYCINRSSRRKRGMASNPLFITPKKFLFSKQSLLWLP